MDYTIKIGGEAGQGIQTVGETLAKVFSRSGYHVFTHQDYESRVRGGHNFYQVRLADRPITASRAQVDILVAMDKQSIGLHAGELSAYGQVVYDSQALKQAREGVSFLDVPFERLALEHGGSRIMANTVAVGAVLGMLGMDLEILIGIIRETFRKKGDDVIAANRAAALAGHDHAAVNCLRCSFSAGRAGSPKMLIAGNEALGLGVIASGCKFYAAYPMTPSTGIMNFVADNEKEYGIIVEQAEDEIAAINMALGASFGGVRAMTGTSGGGFALMAEGLSLAGMTETPVVIALAQRPGPATGFPTRTEQGDLQFALSAGHGEFPRVILAPGTPEQAMLLASKAFDLAEKYQIPVIIMTDQYLADSQWTYDGLGIDALAYRDYRVRGEQLEAMPQYKRHEYTETGVTPLAVPGISRHLVVADSDEHDEEGHIVEDAGTRIRMVEKRLFKKLPALREEMEPPVRYGHDDPDVVVAGWGSMYGIMREVVDALSGELHIAMLHFSEVYPLPPAGKLDYLKVLRDARLAVCVEQNATGQFARLLRAETGYSFTKSILRYDGRPFLVEELLGEIRAISG